jgi:uridine kinase
MDSWQPMGMPDRRARQLRLPAAHLESLAAIARERAAGATGGYVIAIDGRSGAGKSTLAARLAVELGARLVDGDGFFDGGVELRSDTPEDRARACIDWRRQRAVLQSLRAGREARYFAFDWDAFDGRREPRPTRLAPAPLVVLEGAYSARPELHDLVDLRVLLVVSDATRRARLLAREGNIGRWETQWHEAEDWYFAHVAPTSSFDVVVDGNER